MGAAHPQSRKEAWPHVHESWVPSKADRDLDLRESRAKGSIGLFLVQSLVGTKSVTNRPLKPPTHAAISHAFEAVQCNKLLWSSTWRHPILGRVLPQPASSGDGLFEFTREQWGRSFPKGWGVLPRFVRVKPVMLGCESDQTSLLPTILNPSTGRTTVTDKGASDRQGASKR